MIQISIYEKDLCCKRGSYPALLFPAADIASLLDKEVTDLINWLNNKVCPFFITCWHIFCCLEGIIKRS